MSQSRVILAFFAVALAFAFPAFATEPQVSPETPAEAEEAPPEIKAEDPAAKPDTKTEVAEDPVICKRVESTGSRLDTGKRCKRASVWKKLEKDSADSVEQLEKDGKVTVRGQGN